MADGRHFAKSVKSPFICNLLTDLMQFGATMHIALLQRTDRLDFELYNDIQYGGGRHLENYKNRDISANV